MDENYGRAACEDVELATRILRLGNIGYVEKAEIYHPRRYRTVTSSWKSRKNWRYVMYLAATHGFLAWPGNPTRYPRLRTAIAATVTLPLGKAAKALNYATKYPFPGLRAAFLAAVEGFGALTEVPIILFAKVPKMKSSLLKNTVEPQ